MMEEQGKREREEVSVGDAIIYIYYRISPRMSKNRRTNDVNNKIVLEAGK